jgi:hypothetical protein
MTDRKRCIYIESRGRRTVVLGSLWNNNQISSLNLLLFPTYNSLTDTTSKDQMLIDGMYFLSDITTNGDSHDDKLRTLSGPEYIPEFRVLGWDRVDSLEMVHFLRWGWHLGWSGWCE